MNRWFNLTLMGFFMFNTPPAACEDALNIDARNIAHVLDIDVSCNRLVPGASSNECPGSLLQRSINEALSIAKTKLKEVENDAISLKLHLHNSVYRLKKPLILDGGGIDWRRVALSLDGDSNSFATVTGIQSLGFSGNERGFRRYKPFNINASIALRSQSVGDGVAPGLPMVVADSEILEYSRFPKRDWLMIGRDAHFLSDSNRLVLKKSIPVSPECVSDSAYVFGYWGFKWAGQLLRVKIVSGVELQFLDRLPDYGVLDGGVFYLLNVDACPEEGVSFDHDSTVISIPFKQLRSPSGVTYSAGLLMLSGVRNVALSNIRFVGSNDFGVVVRSSEDVSLRNSVIEIVAGTALSVQGSHITLSDIQISHIGGAGVIVDGGNRINLVPGSNEVSRISVDHYGLYAPSYNAGVILRGVGNSLKNSKIRNGRHSGVTFFGNDHLISGNEIENVCSETSDAGAVYVGRDWASQGTVIVGNTIAHVRSSDFGVVRGVYLDDQASGITVRSNLFLDVDYPVYIGGGRQNVVDGNLFVTTGPAVHVDARGILGGVNAERRRSILMGRLRSVPYGSGPYLKYGDLARILDDEPGLPRHNRVSGNVVIGGTLFDAASGVLPLITDEDNYLLGQ